MVLELLDDGAQRLLTVLLLPLLDGVFATLLVTGAVETFTGAVNVALTVFTGAGALAVLYSHSESRRHAQKMVLKVVPVLMVAVVAVALLAPVFEQLFYISRLRYAAGLALLAIAAQLWGLEVSEHFPAPAIVVTGMIVSIQDPSALALGTSYLIPAVTTAAVAGAGLFAATYLVDSGMRIEYVRRGGAFVLGTIALSQFGFAVPENLALMIFAASIVASLGSRNSGPRTQS